MSQAQDRSPNQAEPAAPARRRPWWREPVMWLVVGGPALVVVASFATLGLALHYPDPVLETANEGAAKSMQPAKEGRNHAATGGK